MTVLGYASACSGIPFPQHGSGNSRAVQSYILPGAAQSRSRLPTILSYANAFPGLPFPQHGSGASSVQSFVFPGAVQPQQGVLAAAQSPISYATSEW